MVKGCKVIIKAVFGKVSKEWRATVFRIYYSGFVYRAAACILYSKTNTVLLALSAKLFSWVELMTNNMLEEISSQPNLL